MEKEINANPTKEFFIKMLTRDIDLEPALAELVDNSLDGAKQFRKNYSYEGECNIFVNFDKDSFCISDTCGGISISDARDYCFRFGRDPERKFDLSDGTGVFGIGMKRALFRLGREFEIKSVTPKESFKIHIDVDEWLREEGDNWVFKFEEINENEDNRLEECGTTIKVTKLFRTISTKFSTRYFENAFVDYINKRSSTINPLRVNVYINEKNVKYDDIKLLFDSKFKPGVLHKDFDGVSITIVSGCAKVGEPKRAGWYISCNDRFVLFANQTEDTGWGTEGISSFHTSFASFRGIVMFKSSDLVKLPWNTSKTGVDLTSKYYQIALEEMRDIERKYIEWKRQVDAFIEASEGGIDSKTIFNGEEIGFASEKIKEYINRDVKFEYPDMTKEIFPGPEKPTSRISFVTEKHKIDLVKNKFGNMKMANKKVGEEVFDYYFKREIKDYE